MSLLRRFCVGNFSELNLHLLASKTYTVHMKFNLLISLRKTSSEVNPLSRAFSAGFA